MSEARNTTYHDSPLFWKDLLLQGLKEDQWLWDFTSLGSLKTADQQASAKIIAKGDGIWACAGLIPACEAASTEMGFSLRIESSLKNGETFKNGDSVFGFRGAARGILAVERPFLNLAAYACGISTQTRTLVDLLKKACPKNTPRVTLTRKTLPHYRDLAIHAVICGGGYPHRINLGGGVLIKENHITAGGGISPVFSRLQQTAPHPLRLEIEVKSLSELDEALRAKPDGVLLDNFEPSLIKKALEKINKISPRPFVEVSGGIHEKNIKDFAISGVSVLSVGALTHSVPATDFSLLVDLNK
ncbi:MAG: carboxylating nicotinate-nucleotide diphosphorylase [Bdellovibrionota bacterium]